MSVFDIMGIGAWCLLAVVGVIAWYRVSKGIHEDNIKEKYGDNPTQSQLDEYWNEIARTNIQNQSHL